MMTIGAGDRSMFGARVQKPGVVLVIALRVSDTESQEATGNNQNADERANRHRTRSDP